MLPYDKHDLDGMSPSLSHPSKKGFVEKFIGLQNSKSGVAVIAGGDNDVDIQFDAAYDGFPVTCTLNTVDGTATSIKAAVWNGTGLLTIFANAAATGNTKVSYFIDPSANVKTP